MRQSLWLVWAAVALGAALLEVTTLHLVFIMFSGGAAVAAVTALLGLGPAGQAATFAAASAALLVLIRPISLRVWRQQAPPTLTGVAALVGQPAEVVEAVTSRGGRVKLAGELWTARCDGARSLPVGARARVTAIDGATAVVAPAEPAP